MESKTEMKDKCMTSKTNEDSVEENNVESDEVTFKSLVSFFAVFAFIKFCSTCGLLYTIQGVT